MKRKALNLLIVLATLLVGAGKLSSEDKGYDLSGFDRVFIEPHGVSRQKHFKPGLTMLQPRDLTQTDNMDYELAIMLGYAGGMPAFDSERDSAIARLLAEELRSALAKSTSFNILEPAGRSDLQQIERELNRGSAKVADSTDKMPTATFFIGSSIAIDGAMGSQKTFSAPAAVNRVLGTWQPSGYTERQIRLRVTVVIHVYQQRSLLYSTRGTATITHKLRGYEIGGLARGNDENREFIRLAVSRAVADAFSRFGSNP